jgi:hypothetical protein
MYDLLRIVSSFFLFLLGLAKALQNAFRCVLAVSSFRLLARLDIPIPSPFSGQPGLEPAFGYSAPHLSARRTSTLLNNELPTNRS